MKKRIVFVQPLLAPYLVPRFEALAELGEFDVHIVVESAGFEGRVGWSPREVRGCHVYVAKSRQMHKTLRDGCLGYTDSLTKTVPYGLPLLLARLAPDAVIICNPTEAICAALAKTLVPFRTGLILEDTPTSQAKKRRIVQTLRKHVYRMADFVICFSEDAKRYAQSIGINAPLHRSSWSIDPLWLGYKRKAEGPPSAKYVIRIPQSIVRFLIVGALRELKGHLPFLKAWTEFSKGKDDVELIVVGDGPLRSKAEAFCLNQGLRNVRIRGNVLYETVKEFYLSSDVFVLPTLEDLFGLVVTEAMAFGLPVLTTPYAGARELIRDGYNGYLFDPAVQCSTVQALEKIYSQRNRLTDMGNNSREIISRYTHEEVMHNLAQILEKECS
ncbi:MAG: glycosyltransferase family 4 protein [Thermodesulfobacteriota bacterium]|nr:glycosyltransferase family 4 protein [Thermodesulfobacteriota bacterium]